MFTSYTVATTKSYKEAFGSPFEVNQRQNAKAFNLKASAMFIVAYLNSVAKEWRANYEKATGNKLKVTNVDVIAPLFDEKVRATMPNFPELQGATGALALFEKMRPYARKQVFYDGDAFRDYVAEVIQALPDKAPELVSKDAVLALFETDSLLDSVIETENAKAKSN